MNRANMPFSTVLLCDFMEIGEPDKIFGFPSSGFGSPAGLYGTPESVYGIP